MGHAREQWQAQKDTEELQWKAFSYLIFKILFFISHQISLLCKGREGCWSELFSLAFKAFLDKKHSELQKYVNLDPC